MKTNNAEVTLCGLKLSVDIDAKWKDFEAEDFDTQLETVTSSYFWMTQIYGVGLDENAMKQFWEPFQRSDASRAREIAIYGIARVNNHELFSLLKDAMDYDKARESGDYEKDKELGMLDGCALGLRFAKLAANKNPGDFRRMAELLKHGGEIEGTRGGEDTLEGEIIREFCQHVANTRTLPTKKEIRVGVGIKSDDKNRCDKLRDSLKNLGLSGLTQSRKA